MSADLYIHAAVGIDEFDMGVFKASSFGSKHFSMARAAYYQGPGSAKSEEVHSRIAASPQVHVGSVSWLKAAIIGDDTAYVPDAVAEVHDITGEDLPVIDDGLIARVKDALALENHSQYRLNDVAAVLAFLEAHKGQRAFTVSW